jgi:hypothetical protein
MPWISRAVLDGLYPVVTTESDSISFIESRMHRFNIAQWLDRLLNVFASPPPPVPENACELQRWRKFLQPYLEPAPLGQVMARSHMIHFSHTECVESRMFAIHPHVLNAILQEATLNWSQHASPHNRCMASTVQQICDTDQ